MKKLTHILVVFILFFNFSCQKIDLGLKELDISAIVQAEKSVINNYFSLADASVNIVKGFSSLKPFHTSYITNQCSENVNLPAPISIPSVPQNQGASNYYSIFDLTNTVISVGKVSLLKQLSAAQSAPIANLSSFKIIDISSEVRELRGSPGGYFFLHLLLMFILFFYSRPRGAIEGNIITILNILKIQSRFKGLDFLFAVNGSLL